MRSLGVALLGLGTVGSAVAEALLSKQPQLSARIGSELRLVAAAVRDPSRVRSSLAGREGIRVVGPAEAAALVAHDDVDVVIELTGLADEGARLMGIALDAGKDVVTANKAAIALHGVDLHRRAAARRVELRYEASVGGGIPLLRPLERDLAGNDLSCVRGIVNGTTNYILGRMARGLPFADALAEAQKLGYAEPDPTADVEGIDAAYKLAILATLAFRSPVAPDEVFREGISKLEPRDFRYAEELGYVVKLLALTRLRPGANGSEAARIEARVHPAFVPLGAPLAKIEGATNAVEVQGDLVGSVVFSGPGAGARPTASAVLGDVVAVARRRAQGQEVLLQPPRTERLAVLPIGEVRSRYYLRIQVTDRPGVFAQVTGPLGDRSISLAQVLQREASQPGQAAEVVLLTYDAREADMQAAVKTLATLPAVNKVSALVRVETL